MAVGRTWLAPDGRNKAAVRDARPALGHQLRHNVRFPGTVPDLMVAGEGAETVLSSNASCRRCRTSLPCRGRTSVP